MIHWWLVHIHVTLMTGGEDIEIYTVALVCAGIPMMVCACVCSRWAVCELVMVESL